MIAYMDECACLAAEVPKNRCPATDALEWLDNHPEYRLALEDTWSDDGGKVYREVPADRISRWPGQISKAFRAFLRIAKDPDQVFRLLDLLHELDASPELVHATLTGCSRRKSLTTAIRYFETLATELREVTCPQSTQELTLGIQELACSPRLVEGDVGVGSWRLVDDGSSSDDAISPSYRAELLHDPTRNHEDPRDWIRSQPRAFSRLLYKLKGAKPQALPFLKKQLLDGPEGVWSRSQLEVLWDHYRIRRDMVRRREERVAAKQLGVTAQKLIRRINRIGSRPELGKVGKGLYLSMKGKIRLPGLVSQPEWGVVFEAYRSRRAEIISAHS